MWLLWGLAFANPIPIHSLPHSCVDPRFPLIHDGWIIGCNAKGMIDRAYHLESMRMQRLDAQTEFVGLGIGLLQEKVGTWSLIEEKRNPFPRIQQSMNAPPAGSIHGWAYTTDDTLNIVQDRIRHDIPVHARGWYPPVWWGDIVVWVEDNGKGEGELWRYSASTGASVLRKGKKEQRHPVSFHNKLAWIEGDSIGVWFLGERDPHFVPADVVDRLAMDTNRVCWSARGVDIDIHCDDGFVLKREGHQLWPSLWNGFLLFREADRLMLYRLES